MDRKSKITRLGLLVILISVFSLVWLACEKTEEPLGPTRPDTTVELTIADGTHWPDNGPDTYIFDQQVFCFSPIAMNGRVRFWVEDNKIIRGIRLQDCKELDTLEFNIYSTIDELLSLAAKAEISADEYTVTYDTIYGFPQNIFVDWVTECYDEEISYSTTLIQVP